MNLLQVALKNGNNQDQVIKISVLLNIRERIEANGNVRLQLASVMI
jgi:hypothetical protein